MKKYLYVFNYPPEDKELCALEFRTLFKDEFKSKYYLSNKDYSVDKSVCKSKARSLGNRC